MRHLNHCESRLRLRDGMASVSSRAMIGCKVLQLPIASVASFEPLLRGWNIGYGLPRMGMPELVWWGAFLEDWDI